MVSPFGGVSDGCGAPPQAASIAVRATARPTAAGERRVGNDHRGDEDMGALRGKDMAPCTRADRRGEAPPGPARGRGGATTELGIVRAMKRLEFRRHAERFWEEIPAKYRAGAVLLVHWEAEPDPENPGVHLFGACESAFGALDDALDATGGVSPMDRSSLVHLWYGSFRATARDSNAFDWAGEIEETLLHELTHHWEQRAGLDGLDRFDAAQIVNFRRVRGLSVPPGFWRDGHVLGPNAWEIDGDHFVELEGPPPWTYDPEDGEGAVTVGPDPDTTFATVPGRGGWLDDERGDLVLAPRPPVPLAWWRRLFGRAAAPKSTPEKA